MERLNHNTSHLRCDELSDGMVAQKIAYLLRVNRRVDRNGYPYLVFAFKTADKVVLTGRKFKIMENDSIGVQILALNRTVVEVDFEVQIYNGTYSLIVRNIIPTSKQEISCFEVGIIFLTIKEYVPLYICTSKSTSTTVLFNARI